MATIDTSVARFIEEMGPNALSALLNIAEAEHGPTDLSTHLREQFDILTDAQRERTRRLLQAELDLARVGKQAAVIRSCEIPARGQIRDYAAWLRSGGGRVPTGPCIGDHTCACEGTGTAWETR